MNAQSNRFDPVFPDYLSVFYDYVLTFFPEERKQNRCLWKCNWFHVSLEAFRFKETVIIHAWLPEICECQRNFSLYYQKKLRKNFSVEAIICDF